MGAWIEILPPWTTVQRRFGRPHMGTWIEISGPSGPGRPAWCRPRMRASAFSRYFAGPAENNGVFGRSRNMMIAVSIAVSQVDSSRTFVKIFGPFRNSYLHHRASPVLSYGISDLAIRLKWMLSAYAPAGRNWPPAMLVLFAGIRRIPQEPGRAGFRSVQG